MDRSAKFGIHTLKYGCAVIDQKNRRLIPQGWKVVKGARMATAKSDAPITSDATGTENDDVKFTLTPADAADFSKPAIIGRMEAGVLGVAEACSNLKECTDQLLADLPQCTQLIRAMHAANADNPCFGLAAFAQQLTKRLPMSERGQLLFDALDRLGEVWKSTPALEKCSESQLQRIQKATNKVLCARYHYV